MDAETTFSTIRLPGTTDEAGYGEKTTGSNSGYLTRACEYYGVVWYEHEVEIPQQWQKKRIVLKLERVLWESRVFLGDKEVSVCDALSVPHCHDLGYLLPGKHKIRIRIDNNMIHNIGDKGHSYTEHTQSIWNGIVGRIELMAEDRIHFSNPQVYTTVSPCTLEIKDIFVNESGKQTEAEVNIRLLERESGQVVFSQLLKQSLAKGPNAFHLTTSPIEGIKPWNDVTPHLYTLQISMKSGEMSDTRTVDIGFRQVSTAKSKILINGQPTFMRGNVDCVHFPLTGYPSCRTEDWERIFRIYKSYGLNHVRFHSWCPPEAAFVAADKTGIYIQTEIIWIDDWMTNPPKDRPDMITKGNPEGLGKNPSADAFIQKELSRISETYGNHPSFIMQCIGNELTSSDFEVMASWIKPLQENDNRRLFSLSTARKVTPADQYIVTHDLPGTGATRGSRGGASTDWDFEDVYSKSNIPVIAHEIGQWPVYPRWDEIKKYKGVLKARNFEGFQQEARKNHIEEQNDALAAASGALNQLMYKYEIESFLRTPSCAGFQLLSMQDYQGLGEALIGWLDVFYDSKEITTPERFRMHSDTIVPLLRIPKFVWKNDEAFTGKLQLAHYGTHPLNDGLYWKIKDEQNNLIAQGETASRTYPVGSSEITGEIKCSLSGITTAKKLTVEVGLQHEVVKNSWNIWVYPASVKPENGDVYIADSLDETCIAQLEKGGKVFLQAAALGTGKTTGRIYFYPVYWSPAFFPEQKEHTIGMILQDRHPLFSEFPTDTHSDWQWEALYKNAKAFYINDFPENYKPIAQPVDNFHRNNKLAAIFELKVGKGKLLVSGFDVSNETNPVAVQLKNSILHYMNTADFHPDYEVSVSALKEMFRASFITSLHKSCSRRVAERHQTSVFYCRNGQLTDDNFVTTNWCVRFYIAVDNAVTCVHLASAV
ncbi:beta-galactosidase [Planctomycetales bacterium]|nr:beta-galactosidase [Planctomycetales bacterium]